MSERNPYLQRGYRVPQNECGRHEWSKPRDRKDVPLDSGATVRVSIVTCKRCGIHGRREEPLA